MKLDKRIFDRIADCYRDNPDMSEEELFGLIDTYVSKPDPVDLMHAWKKRMATYIVSRLRDEDNIRNIFAAKDETGKTKYVFTEKSSDQKKLDSIRRTLFRKYKGLEKSFKKVNKRFQTVSGQTTLEFEFENNVNQ
ncbi:hypothetical protein SCACP_21760 [Sporomusa carbonis]|uniref:hypothetical protein n=1 Tax=Sporomusa carbonis TaxID=3076075 RepID=UPI003A6D7D0F